MEANRTGPSPSVRIPWCGICQSWLMKVPVQKYKMSAPIWTFCLNVVRRSSARRSSARRLVVCRAFQIV